MKTNLKGRFRKKWCCYDNYGFKTTASFRCKWEQETFVLCRVEGGQ